MSAALRNIYNNKLDSVAAAHVNNRVFLFPIGFNKSCKLRFDADTLKNQDNKLVKTKINNS